jgi:hypothetical protein
MNRDSLVRESHAATFARARWPIADRSAHGRTVGYQRAARAAALR